MERSDFESVFHKTLLPDLEAICKERNLPDSAREWFLDSVQENTIGGKYNRGVMVIRSYEILTGQKLNVSSPEYTRVALLGWMIELLQAFFLVSDDIMDSSKTRRGKPCHYLRPGVGMIAINDAFMLESCIYVLLKKHFRSHPHYIDLVELFHDITLETEFGQQLDLITAPEDNVNLDNFSLEKYSFIVIYKTAFYSFYLPVALALYYIERATPKNLQQAKDILIPMGEYFQVQDDYLDNFQDPEILGKIGTDIQDNKCSWLINQALKLASKEQREVLDKNYGRKDKSAEAEVKKVFNDLKLDQVFHQYEEDCAADLERKIQRIDESEGLKKGVFDAFFQKIYKRQK